jgi:hypothetical protein
MPDAGSAWPLSNATVKLLCKRVKYIGGAGEYMRDIIAIT